MHDRFGVSSTGAVFLFPFLETFVRCARSLPVGSIRSRFLRRGGGDGMSREELIRRLTELLEQADDEKLEVILLFVERYIRGGH